MRQPVCLSPVQATAALPLQRADVVLLTPVREIHKCLCKFNKGRMSVWLLAQSLFSIACTASEQNIPISMSLSNVNSAFAEVTRTNIYPCFVPQQLNKRLASVLQGDQINQQGTQNFASLFSRLFPYVFYFSCAFIAQL